MATDAASGSTQQLDHSYQSAKLEQLTPTEQVASLSLQAIPQIGADHAQENLPLLSRQPAATAEHRSSGAGQVQQQGRYAGRRAGRKDRRESHRCRGESDHADA